jgi:hypothetical protein
LGISAEALAQIDTAVLTKSRDGHASAQVDLLQVAVGSEDEAAVGAILALPVVKAAIGGRAVDG